MRKTRLTAALCCALIAVFTLGALAHTGVCHEENCTECLLIKALTLLMGFALISWCICFAPNDSAVRVRARLTGAPTLCSTLFDLKTQLRD